MSGGTTDTADDVNFCAVEDITAREAADAGLLGVGRGCRISAYALIRGLRWR